VAMFEDGNMKHVLIVAAASLKPLTLSAPPLARLTESGEGNAFP